MPATQGFHISPSVLSLIYSTDLFYGLHFNIFALLLMITDVWRFVAQLLSGGETRNTAPGCTVSVTGHLLTTTPAQKCRWWLPKKDWSYCRNLNPKPSLFSQK